MGTRCLLRNVRVRTYTRSMSTTRWWKYVESVAGDASNVEIARHVDIDPSAVSRWKKGQNPDIGFVVKFARQYNRNVLEAVAAAEFITDAEAALREVRAHVGDLSSDELAVELLRRTR